MSDLHTPLLPPDDGHGGGGESGPSMTPAPSVEPKPEQPDAASEPRRDDSEKDEDPEGAEGRGYSAVAGDKTAADDLDKVTGAAGDEVEEVKSEGEKEPGDGAGVSGRGVPAAAGHRSGEVEEKSEGEKGPGDGAGVSPDAARYETSVSIESSHDLLKDLEADLAGASTTAAKLEAIKKICPRFGELAASSSIAAEALSFLRAVEQFNAKKERKKKVADMELSQAGRLLSDAARRAPSSESAVAQIAAKLTGHSQDVLSSLSSDGGCRPCAFLRAWIERAAGPDPILPVHRRERQERLADKRQALFGVALAAPLALLTSAATIQTFPSGLALWIARISVVLWIGVSCGLVLDLYGNTKLQFRLASCLSRLGMIGVTVLVCLFIFGAFFPSATVAVWVVLALAMGLHAWLCIVSCRRGDADDA